MTSCFGKYFVNYNVLLKCGDYFIIIKIIYTHNLKKFKPRKRYDIKVSLSQHSLPEAITVIMKFHTFT